MTGHDVEEFVIMLKEAATPEAVQAEFSELSATYEEHQYEVLVVDTAASILYNTIKH